MHWHDIKTAAADSDRIERESLSVLESYLLHMDSTVYSFDRQQQELADGVRARIVRTINLLRSAENTKENAKLHQASLDHSTQLHRQSMLKANIALFISVAALVVAWMAWKRPVPLVPADSNTSPTNSAPYQTESVSTQLPPPKLPESPLTNQGFQSLPRAVLNLN